MSHRGSDAESKFWEMSELFERLLIDASSVINLVESHARTRELIQRPFVWNKVLKNIVPDNEYVYDWESEEEEEVEKEGMLGSVWNLSRLSDIFEDPTPFQLDLLHLICERNPPNRKSDSLGYHLVELVCCCNQVHVVSPLGFLLLEEVEESWGSTKQIVDKVQLCIPSGQPDRFIDVFFLNTSLSRDCVLSDTEQQEEESDFWKSEGSHIFAFSYFGKHTVNIFS